MGYFVKQSGLITYNESNNEMEYNNGTATVTVAKTGAVPPTIDTITTASASAGPYPITVDYGVAGDYDFDANNPAYLMVYLDGVHQEPVTAYTVTDTNITFTSVPPDGLTITVLHGTYSTDVPNTNIF